MKIDIQSPDFTINPELAGYIHEKVEKLSLYCGEIIGSEVCLRLESSAAKENKICSIRLFIPGNDLLASVQYKKFEQAISQVVEILRRQIKKRKTKAIARRKDNIQLEKKI